MKTLIIITCVLAVIALIIIWTVHYDSIELTPDSPFFNDEIESEGIDKIKFKQ